MSAFTARCRRARAALAPPAAALRRGLLPALLLAPLLALGAVPAAAAEDAPPPHQPAPLQAHRPGDEMALDDCLRLSVLDFTDRNGPLEAADWITVRLRNDCAEPVRHVLVDVLLQDVLGKVYGARLWLLAAGEVLPPGAAKTDRYPVADHADHVPARWGARLRAAERPSDFARLRSRHVPNHARAARPVRR